MTFGAVATYAAWQTVKDGQDKDHRAQAEVVSFWTEDTKHGEIVHVVNRSWDAIPYWSSTIDFVEVNTNGSHWWKEQKRYSSSLPPCTELVFDPGKLPGSASPHASVVDFRFIDRAGEVWERNPWWLEEADGGIIQALQDSTTPMLFAELRRIGDVRAAQDCGKG